MAMNSKMGPPELIAYGIGEDQSDLRVHVCVTVRRLYIYRTKYARQLIQSGKYRKAEAKQAGMVTASGFLVPPGDIPGWVEYDPAAHGFPEVWDLHPIRRTDTTTEKGAAALAIVEAVLNKQKIAFKPELTVVEAKGDQLIGYDLILDIHRTIQVKCDYDGGRKALGGTGNLFLQIAEANPLKRY